MPELGRGHFSEQSSIRAHGQRFANPWASPAGWVRSGSLGAYGIVLEISVLMASFPSRAIAEGSYRFRTLGLGYANLGTVLMRQGISYDSPSALAICGAITAILTGEAYATSYALRMAREGAEFSLSDIAKVTGLPKQNLSRWLAYQVSIGQANTKASADDARR